MGGVRSSEFILDWSNDLKLSDGGVQRGTCMVGGKAAVEAGAVTHGAVRCSAWLGVAVIGSEALNHSHGGEHETVGKWHLVTLGNGVAERSI